MLCLCLNTYVTKEFEGRLTLSKSAERSAAEAAPPHYSEPVTSGFAPSGVADAEIGISNGFKISSTMVAGGPPTVVQETRVSQQVRREAEEASPESFEPLTEGTIFSDTKDSGVSDGSGTSSAVVGLPTVGTGAGGSHITTSLRRKSDDDTMSYAYPKYSNHPDAAAHVKQFRSIWAVNYGTQGLSLLE
jgi:hypothetical protein